MRRALAALAVTAVAVVLLARYETQLPDEPPPRARPQAAAAAPPPGVRVGTGPLITTPFSAIQVRAELTRGRLTGVRTLALSGADAHTRAINARAEPLLRESALEARSADVDVVSGATYTSRSWRDSLRAAIRDARRG